MKKIVTHLSPHLDEIVAIWLLKSLDSAWGDATVEFKATNPQGGEVPLDEVDKNPDVVYFGIGRSRFDEHRLAKEEAAKVSAAVLVWRDLVDRGLTPADPDRVAAIEKLLDFVVKDDTGELKSMDHWLGDFSIAALWGGFSQKERGDSEKKLAYGIPLTEYMVTYLNNVSSSERQIKEKGSTFTSPWGPGLAIESEYSGIDPVAYRQGTVVVVGINPKLGYRRIVGKTGSEVNLEEAYHEVTKLDPESDWYLHQSKRMLLSGSHSAPNVKISRLSMNELINLVKA
jgi:hypothetical protein